MSTIFFDAGPPASGQKVCLATTAYDGVAASYAFSIQRSREALMQVGIQSAYFLLSGNCHVDDARNTVVQEFLLTDCTDLVFLDADVSWDPESLIELCQYDCDVVGGVYPYKRAGMENAMPVRPLLSDAAKMGDGLVEVEGLPTGFMRIRRHVLERLAADAPSHWGEHEKRTQVPIVFERTLEGGIRWGGDLNFCRKWRAMGGKVFAAAEMRLGHSGDRIIVDSLAASARRASGLTLRYIVEAIRDGRETPGHYVELFEYIGNVWGAPPSVLTLAVVSARQADGPIIETGSGLTTILMAAATDQPVYCLEHDPFWAEHLEKLISESGVTGIGLCVCPIKDGWYDLSDYEAELPSEFALGLNDGPPRVVGDRMGFYERFGLCTDTIIVDDADDRSYGNEIEAWCAENDRRVDFIEQRAALIRHNVKEKAHAAA